MTIFKHNEESPEMIKKEDEEKKEKELIYKSNFVITKLQQIKSTGQTLKRYQLDNFEIEITDHGEYLISQESLSPEAEEFCSVIMDSFLENSPKDILGSDDVIMQRIEDHIDTIIEKTEQQQEIWETERDGIMKQLAIQNVGFLEIHALTLDKDIEDILCTHKDRYVAVIYKGDEATNMKMLKTNVKFGEKQLQKFISKIAGKYASAPTTSNPIVSCSTKTNDRMIFMGGLGGISPDSETFAIRKFPERTYVITDMLKGGVLSLEVTAYLWFLLDATPFILLSGSTGSGKTTLINALMGLTHPRLHVIVLEDTRELKLPHYWGEYNLTTNEQLGDNGHTMMDLIKTTLRRKPHFVIIGEVRSEETREMFQGAATGHGALTSFHGAGIEETIARLRNDPINITDNQMLNLWVIMHVGRIQNNKGEQVRRLRELIEIQANTKYNEEDIIGLVPVFKYSLEHDKVLPDDFEEIVKKSKKIHMAAEVLGIQDVDIVSNLQKRKEILQKCVDNNASTPKEVFQFTSELYNTVDPWDGE